MNSKNIFPVANLCSCAPPFVSYMLHDRDAEIANAV